MKFWFFRRLQTRRVVILGDFEEFLEKNAVPVEEGWGQGDNVGRVVRCPHVVQISPTLIMAMSPENYPTAPEKICISLSFPEQEIVPGESC